MLYDPKWTGTFTLLDLIAWLETKDPNGWYNFMQPSTCAAAQWTGNTNLVTQNYRFMCLQLSTIDDVTFPGCEKIFHAPDGGEWTFGAALDRARAMRDAK